MKKRMITGLVAASMFVGLLGCGTQAFAEEEVVLEAFYYDARGNVPYDNLYAKFTEKYPHIKIEVTNGDAIYDTMIASGTMPDMIMGEYASLYEYGSAGHLVDISGEEWLAASLPENVIEMITLPNDAVYGIPSNYACMGLFYNQEMFEAAGIEEFPKTVSALREACEKLVAAGYTPFSVCGTQAWTLGQMFSSMVDSVHEGVLEYGKNAIKAGTTEGLEYPYDDLVAAMETISIMFEYQSEGSMENDYAAFMNEFATGQVAMLPMGTWAIVDVLGLNPEFTVRYAGLPYTENPEDVKLSVFTGVSVAAASSSEHVEECLLLMEWLASEEGQYWFAEYFGEIPFLDVEMETNEIIEDIKAYIDAGKASGVWTWAIMTTGGELEINNAMQEYYLGMRSAEDVITYAYENLVK